MSARFCLVLVSDYSSRYISLAFQFLIFYLQNMTRRLKQLRSLIRPVVTGYTNHEINNKTLYAIFAVSTLKYFPFLGGLLLMCSFIIYLSLVK